MVYKRIASTGNLACAPSGGHAFLGTVNVNTGAASATFSIYDGTSASGTLIAVIDASSKSSHYYGVRCPNGIFCVLAAGNADVTVGVE